MFSARPSPTTSMGLSADVCGGAASCLQGTWGCRVLGHSRIPEYAALIKSC